MNLLIQVQIILACSPTEEAIVSETIMCEFESHQANSKPGSVIGNTSEFESDILSSPDSYRDKPGDR